MRLVGSDHPRSCGANKVESFKLSDLNGSSPLVRGQRGQYAGLRRRARIIPARAGPTFSVINVGYRFPDHPRSCGANKVESFKLSDLNGSSPLVRGQLNASNNVQDAIRIIPARAGPTTPSTGVRPPSTDHPRSCGANSIGVSFLLRVFGSSPLVRGQQSDFTRKKRVESNKNI